jgi:hypothetical protein
MYRGFLIAVVLTYAVSAWRGWELGGAKRGFIPKEARQEPGGYRSYHFWRGGK